MSSISLIIQATLLRVALINSGVDGFTVLPNNQCISKVFKSSPLIQYSSKDDDWYSDFNPNEFSKYTKTETPRRDYGQDRYSKSTSSSQGYNRRTGGGGGKDFNTNYERDTSDDNSNVDVEVITKLLQSRVSARKDGEYDAADAIRDELLNVHGVQVWDKERVWRSGCSAGGSGGRFKSQREERSPRQGRKPQQDFGPNGHDYQLAPDAGPISASFTEDQIHELLALRLQSKLSRSFEKADRIQQELASAGVYVHDARKIWRADGELFGDDNVGGRPGRERGSRNDRNAYTQSVHSMASDLTEDDIKNIQSLISRRTNAKASRDYNTADNIRDELKNAYNVFIEDRLKEWSVNGDFGPDAPGVGTDQYQPWTQSQFSKQSNGADADIISLLEKRSVAKADRDFTEADNLRDVLMNEYNVEINDRLREWSIGGDFGLPTKKNNDRNRPFVRRGSGDLTDDEIDTISSMVEERAEAKKNRDFATADEIRDELDRAFSVKVDDKSEYHFLLF